MATFTFHQPTGSYLKATQLDFNKAGTALSFSRNSGKWIYTNYPEKIGVSSTGLALAEHKYCTNKQTVNSGGEAMVFFSHWNLTGKELKYRVRLKNTTSNDITVTRTAIGFSTGWEPAPTVESYYAAINTPISISGNGFAWLTPEYSIASNQPFNGMVKFVTNGTVEVILYAYHDATKILGTEVVYPYSRPKAFTFR